jgi:benzoyl-CoA reductase/2-hydroxyglutaryl-CoA dehydratase subunit BcrC/BadD/HgdB
MMTKPAQITLRQWDRRYEELKAAGLREPFFGGPLSRHVTDGDTRLRQLKLDNSEAALGLWNLLLSENQRLRQYRADGRKIIATMKDLGTVPVMVYSLDNLVAFYPDGVWWTPCLMEQHEGLFELAARYGLDESYCPVRAMLAAFVNAAHFPRPDLIVSSAGAICDDFSAIAQQVEHMGFDIHWWEMPHRRNPQPNEPAVQLGVDLAAPQAQVSFVRRELQRVGGLLEAAAGQRLTEERLTAGIAKANRFRRLLGEIRELAYTAPRAPMGGLEMLIAEMLALHYCSDYQAAMDVLEQLQREITMRVSRDTGVLAKDAARIFWINPVADLRAMNLLEDCGGRICGTEYLFSHTLDVITEDIDPMEALARTALADPMAGSTVDRTRRIEAEIRRFGAEGVILSRIPGASHCAYESALIGEALRKSMHVPVVEIEVPSLCDAAEPTLRTRLEALVETIKQRRQP